MSEIRATVLADSINPAGIRLTTFELVFHRFILAEVNTHRAASRNSASSRAIPVEKMLDRFRNDWAYPLNIPAEQKGMSGGAELEGQDRIDAEILLRAVHRTTADLIQAYLDAHPDKSTRLHKSVLNRLMEWGQWHTAIFSATDWDNFYDLRLAPNAQPEFRALAEAMKAAQDASTPKKLKRGEWHLPLTGFPGDEDLVLTELIKVSAARCARVSYLTHQGTRDVFADFGLFDKLAFDKHMSPFEHPAQAQGGKTGSGNYRGFKQARRFVELGEEFEKPLKTRPKRTIKKANVLPIGWGAGGGGSYSAGYGVGGGGSWTAANIVTSSNTIIPSMPQVGSVRWDTGLQRMQSWNGYAWVDIP